ncbi:MAG: putative toxin-antitoxin system toxin component, PIN family [Burkholderiaceae bacterium]|nr:putative toxin-antitoxin system toxin component, PIN family [Burkholderiaceae bacterium]
MTGTTGTTAVRLVVDTNVLLDCWAFDDPVARPLWQAIAAGGVTCLRSAATDDELLEVMQRPPFHARLAARDTDPTRCLARWQALAEPVERVFAAPWACTDPHDQKFLDLARTGRAHLLVTKDKALLSLARRARRDGLAIEAVAAALLRLSSQACAARA